MVNSSLFSGNLVDTGSVFTDSSNKMDLGGHSLEAGPVESPANPGEPALVEQENAKTSAEKEKEAGKEPEVVEPPKKEDKAFSKKFAALSKKEKAIRQREAAVNKRMAELEAKLKAMEAPAAPAKVEIPLEQRLKRDPIATLTELGLPYEKLTQLVLNDGKLSPDMQMQLIKEELESKHTSELDKLKQDIQQKELERAKQQEAQVLNNFKAELTEFVNSDPNYELIQANNASAVVFNVIEEHYNNTGRILSNKEAADYVESHLLEEARKLLKLKKLGVAQQVAAQTPPTKPGSGLSKPTLTNQAAATLSNPKLGKKLTDEESKLAAANLIRWND